MKLPVLNALISFLLLPGSPGFTHAALPSSQLAPAGESRTLAETGRDPAQFPGYVEQLKAAARQQGFDETTLNAAFANVHFVDRVVQSDRGQLEQKITLNDYLSRVLSQRKIDTGRQKLVDYRSQLDAVAAGSGVAPPYIVALWGMESQFGAIQGKEEVISALATLAFEGRREAFFTNELMAALRIIQQQQMSAEALKGSWAGAMGQSQFMPSSFLNYARDGDGDGKIDIWNNVDDVFASMANYLQQEGWQAGQGWGVEVTLPAGFESGLAGLKTAQAKPPEQWRGLGVTLTAAPRGEMPARAWIVTPQDGDGRSFMVFDNFRTLMNWNRSYYFAISIGMMADAIAQ